MLQEHRRHHERSRKSRLGLQPNPKINKLCYPLGQALRRRRLSLTPSGAYRLARLNPSPCNYPKHQSITKGTHEY